MRRFDTFAAIILLAAGVMAGLFALVLVNAGPVARAMIDAVQAGSYRLADACVALFSLGPLQPILILLWLLLLALLLWVALRLAWEMSRRCLRTRAMIARLVPAAPPAASSVLARQCRELGLTGSVDTAECPTAFAFCHGLRSPRILVSSGLLRRLSAAELRAVLLHEQVHRQRRDPLRLLVAESLAAVFSPMRLVRGLVARLALEQELTADGAAVHAQGGATELASAMLHLIDDGSLPQQLDGLTVSGITPTAARVEALSDPKATRAHLAVNWRHLRMSVAGLGASGIAGIAFTLAVQAGRVVHHCSAMSQTLLHSLI